MPEGTTPGSEVMLEDDVLIMSKDSALAILDKSLLEGERDFEDISLVFACELESQVESLAFPAAELPAKKEKQFVSFL